MNRRFLLTGLIVFFVVVAVAARERTPCNSGRHVYFSTAAVPSLVRVGSLALPFESSAVAPAICTPDCPQDIWRGPDTVIYTLASGCPVQVIYWYRIACDIFYDTQITEVKQLVPSCKNISFSQLFAEAELKLIEQNPMRFPPIAGRDPDGLCVSTYRATRVSCFRYDALWSTPIIPCERFDCCLALYVACLNDGVRIVNLTGWGANITNSCDEVGGCRFTCPQTQ